jgi:hypothetical protein
MHQLRRLFLLSFAVLTGARAQTSGDAVSIVLAADAAPRVVYGAGRLAEVLRTDAKLSPQIAAAGAAPSAGREILVGKFSEERIRSHLGPGAQAPAAEGFVLATDPSGGLVVAGADDSGVLYGCLELARRARAGRMLPASVSDTEAPAFRLRGPCIGMQKTTILPGYGEYEYPYTPELFPFFYDKAFWQGYLDFLAGNRMNTLYLWNGHPFPSLVKLPDYPYALEVSEEDYQRNVAMYRYLIQEADKRGIRLVQMFYNIELSKPFAEHNHLPTSLAAPTALAADYTRKSIAEFVRQYPQVELMVCLGGALQGTDHQANWLTQVILPGFQDGLRQAGVTSQPALILRTHGTDPAAVLPAALQVYPHLDTEEQLNGEAFTTSEPRGSAQGPHEAMSRQGGTHLATVQLLANLEPFRYGDQRFIKLSVQAMRDRLGARGIQVCPLSPRSWPYTPDKLADPLLQYQRDWIWFEAWARYAWNPDIPEAEDRAYWIGRLATAYGADAAENILAAYNDSGECAPRIIRRFGLTDGDRQTMSLGMTLDQLVHPEKYRANPPLRESGAPPGESLAEYVDRQWNKQPHTGETPPRVLWEILHYSEQAEKAVDAAAVQVTDNVDEFGRLLNDVHCIRELSLNYAAKAQAALLVLRFAHSHEIGDMDQAARLLAESLDHYRALARLTAETYLYANSLQTSQRSIPVQGGRNGQPENYHWTQLLPLYEKELADFQAQVAALRRGPP